MECLYKKDEFSKASEIDVYTLDFYNKIGLLNPSIVAENNVFYTDDDLENARQINFFKSVGFTLGEIAYYKDSLSSDIVEQKQNEITEQMEELQLKYDKLEAVKRKIRGKIHNLYIKFN
ncbi:MAG: MerR family transcriptional regulator [Bacilli bacterium]|nr:MerR family transcriptional regulator [Bacilli bacterium]